VTQQITKNEDGTFTVLIMNPYEVPTSEGGKPLSDAALKALTAGEVDRVVIGKVYARHLMAVDGTEGATMTAIMLQALTGVPLQVIKRMDFRDFSACGEAVAAQMGKSRTSGAES
jgi:hypothetical protein